MPERSVGCGRMSCHYHEERKEREKQRKKRAIPGTVTQNARAECGLWIKDEERHPYTQTVPGMMK
jgi:hypothetical protein